MKTLRIPANPVLLDVDLHLVVEFLRQGELVAIPTETVYGLAADVMQPDAIQKIFHVKGRPSDNPLIAHISTYEQLDCLIQNPHPLMLRLAERFWPGPLTIVFERSEQVPAIGSAGLLTIAVRMPNHRGARQIIDALDSPLFAPSANRSGSPSPTLAQHVLDDFEGKISAIVDGGRCLIGIESTVIRWVDGQVLLLRPGSITSTEIEEEIQMKLVRPSNQHTMGSPGVKYRHYAPRAKVVCVEDEQKNGFQDAFAAEVSGSCYIPASISHESLYFHLREADQRGCQQIVVKLNSSIRSDEALMNRITKASGYNSVPS